jgi:hypothetical protein
LFELFASCKTTLSPVFKMLKNKSTSMPLLVKWLKVRLVADVFVALFQNTWPAVGVPENWFVSAWY